MYWLTDGPPDDWPVIITSNETVHERLTVNATELILALPSRPHQLPELLPRDLVATRHRFVPRPPTLGRLSRRAAAGARYAGYDERRPRP